ncbi:hypothetical protein [Sulfuricystis multivorans]|uniref:hypothetical protein n=1 Tax=Sulfuricystis multivorans TaxID=2211108 RepID=UPI000F838D00|nr:hypothetical protein [Sulfuricystis multivorans]
MKARITLSLLFALLVASTPARADLLTGLLVDAASRLLSKGVHSVVDAAKEAVTQESEEDRKARENAEIDKAADQILAQYPEDQREAKKPEVMMRLTKVYAQYKTMEERQEAVRAQQNSIGNIIVDSTVGSASAVIGNRMAIDAAARSAFLRARF